MNIWKKNPTDEVAYVYVNLLDELDGKEKLQRLETLLKVNALRPSLNNRLVAEFSIANKAWGKAKSELEMFLVNNPCTKKVCEMIAEVEEKFDKDKKEAKSWRSRYDSCADDSLWVCASCGAKTSEWHAVCPECKAFGQAQWHLYVEQHKEDVVEEMDDEDEE